MFSTKRSNETNEMNNNVENKEAYRKYIKDVLGGIENILGGHSWAKNKKKNLYKHRSGNALLQCIIT